MPPIRPIQTWQKSYVQPYPSEDPPIPAAVEYQLGKAVVVSRPNECRWCKIQADEDAFIQVTDLDHTHKWVCVECVDEFVAWREEMSKNRIERYH